MDRDSDILRLTGGPPPRHGLTGVPPSGLPSGEDRFDSGARGHGGIEVDALTPLIGLQRAREVYFGNWQRDMSQLITPLSAQVLGARSAVLNELIFRVVDVLAHATFGQRLDRRRFGSYRWEEHLDNPRGYGVAIDPNTYRAAVPPWSLLTRPDPEPVGSRVELWTDHGEGVPEYLRCGRRNALGRLSSALRAGPSRLGREHAGAALHVIEDFYAHSNFTDLVVLRMTGSGDPKTGWEVDGGRPLRDARGRLRITTGVFQSRDTVVSLGKLLIGAVEGHQPLPGDPDVRAELKRVLVRTLLGKEAGQIYDTAVGAWASTGIPAFLGALADVTGLSRLERALTEQVERPLRRAVAGLLQPLADEAARTSRAGRSRVVIGGCALAVIEVTHSQVSKDDPQHPWHPLARTLASHALRDVFQETERAWSRGIKDPRRTDLPSMVTRFTSHPEDAGSWWKPYARQAIARRLGAGTGTVRMQAVARR